MRETTAKGKVVWNAVLLFNPEFMIYVRITNSVRDITKQER